MGDIRFSLADRIKITEEGALFHSHIDGSKHQFTPERAVEIQRTLGADFFMAFDECPAWPSSYEDTRKSMELTHRWLSVAGMPTNRQIALMVMSRLCCPLSKVELWISASNHAKR